MNKLQMLLNASICFCFYTHKILYCVTNSVYIVQEQPDPGAEKGPAAQEASGELWTAGLLTGECDTIQPNTC